MPYDTRSPSSISQEYWWFVDDIIAAQWSNINNISYEDTLVASFIEIGNGSTRLLAQGFNFSIPIFATITGIKVRIKKYSNVSDNNFYIVNNHIQLIKNNVIVGDSQDSVPLETKWSTQSNYIEYGGQNNLWNTTLTPDDINNNTFGVGLAVSGNTADGSERAYIDHIELIVYYTNGEDVMDTDVITKIINSNPIKQGDAVTGVKQNGDYETVDPQINRVPSIDAVNEKYKDKFTITDAYSN